MDRRQKKTKRAIFMAMNQLLIKKRYDKITVADILQEADISRSTFYDHFESKDDLLRCMNDALFRHVFTHPSESEATHDFSEHHQDLQTFLTHTLYHLRDEYPELKGILASESGQLFWQYLKEEFMLMAASQMHAAELEAKVPRAIWENHVAMTFVELVKQWFNQGIEESPECIESYFERLIFRDTPPPCS